MTVIERKSLNPPPSFIIAATGTTSNVVNIAGYVGGSIQFPSAFTSSGVQVQVCNTEDGTFVGVTNLDNNDTGTVRPNIAFVADRVAILWLEIAYFNFMRLVSAGAEAAKRTIPYTLIT